MSRRSIPLRGWLSLHEGDTYARRRDGTIRAEAEKGNIPIYRAGGTEAHPRFVVHTDDIDAWIRTDQYKPDIRLVI